MEDMSISRYWLVALDSVAVDGNIVAGLQADGAIMDTGTSLITVGAADAATINAVCAFKSPACCAALSAQAVQAAQSSKGAAQLSCSLGLQLHAFHYLQSEACGLMSRRPESLR